MKKLAFVMALILMISMPISAFAASRTIRAKSELTFNGATATCKATVFGNDASEYLVVTMKLMYGTTCVASWSSSGYGYVYMEKTASVVRGRTYQLVVEVAVNGVESDPVSVTKTCP